MDTNIMNKLDYFIAHRNWECINKIALKNNVSKNELREYLQNYSVDDSLPFGYRLFGKQ